MVTMSNDKPNPSKVLKRGKAIYLEVVIENWDSLYAAYQNHEKGKRYGKPRTDVSDLYAGLETRFDTATNTVFFTGRTKKLETYQPTGPVKLFTCFYKRCNGIGRMNVKTGRPFPVNILPIKINLTEQNLSYYNAIDEFSGTKVLIYEILSYKENGTIEIRYTDDFGTVEFKLKINEQWQSKISSRKVKPREYFQDFAEAIKRSPENNASMFIPEEVRFTTQVIIRNKGYVNLEEKVYESAF
jgi:hypothetical protein